MFLCNHLMIGSVEKDPVQHPEGEKYNEDSTDSDSDHMSGIIHFYEHELVRTYLKIS